MSLTPASLIACKENGDTLVLRCPFKLEAVIEVNRPEPCEVRNNFLRSALREDPFERHLYVTTSWVVL